MNLTLYVNGFCINKKFKINELFMKLKFVELILIIK